MGHSLGKYGGGIGKETFRRPLRPDARIKKPEYLGRFMRHDWYWGFFKYPLIAGGFYVLGNAYNENYSLAAIDTTIHKDFYDRNRRLSQLRGDHGESITDRSMMLERALKKAQVRAFLAGDIVWKEAVHRLFLDEHWWRTYWYWMHIDPETTEYLPIPLHYLEEGGKFAFHDEKANYRFVQITLFVSFKTVPL